MTEKQFWAKLHQEANRKEKALTNIVKLMRQAYDEDLQIMIGCHHTEDGSVQQLYVALDEDVNRTGMRYLLCYTNKDEAKNDALLPEPCEKVSVRAIVDNALGKDSIGGLVLNRHKGEEGCCVIPKQFLGSYEMFMEAIAKGASAEHIDPYTFSVR